MKTFSFSAATTTKRKSHVKGIVCAASPEAAEILIRNYWQCKGLERIAIVEVMPNSIAVISVG